MNAPIPGKEVAAAPKAECGCGPAGAEGDQLDEQIRSTLAVATQGLSIASLWLAGLD